VTAAAVSNLVFIGFVKFGLFRACLLKHRCCVFAFLFAGSMEGVCLNLIKRTTGFLFFQSPSCFERTRQQDAG
jgi:hypothetical protein